MKNIELIHTDKILFPKSKITKMDLINYYKKISKYILPHLRDRPISMERYPDGISKEGFYQKEIPEYFPHWIKKVKIKLIEEKSYQNQILCQDESTLIYLANQACITPHVWLSKKGKINYPDRLIFDLDPSNNSFSLVKQAALVLKEILENKKFKPQVMTTGIKGLHVIVPIKPTNSFAKIRQFAKNICIEISDKYPNKFTTETHLDKRKGRLFLDYLRNSYGQNTVPPYAVRPIENATVATPLNWEELKDHNINSQKYNITNIFKRLDKKGDIFKNIDKHQKEISL